MIEVILRPDIREQSYLSARIRGTSKVGRGPYTVVPSETAEFNNADLAGDREGAMSTHSCRMRPAVASRQLDRCLLRLWFVVVKSWRSWRDLSVKHGTKPSRLAKMCAHPIARRYKVITWPQLWHRESGGAGPSPESIYSIAAPPRDSFTASLFSNPSLNS